MFNPKFFKLQKAALENKNLFEVLIQTVNIAA